MVVTVIPMRVVQMSINKIVNVIPMRDLLMATAWAVNMRGVMASTLMMWSTGVRIGF